MEYNSNIKIWKDFPGFEGLYQACTDGQVRSVDHNTMGKDGKLHHIKGRILKQAEDKDGYKRVVLCKNGVNYYFVTKDEFEKQIIELDRYVKKGLSGKGAKISLTRYLNQLEKSRGISEYGEELRQTQALFVGVDETKPRSDF